MSDRHILTRYAWLSIATAVFTITLKIIAYLLTGSVGLLSDAIESGVNLAAAVFAFIMLSVATQPPDEEHAYGHDKAEYFSGGVEGALILIAAGTIAVTAVRNLINPQPLEQLGVGLLVTLIASLINLFSARILLRAGEQHYSVTLTADARHLMSDVWTSVGVVAGVGAVALTGWQWLDPVIALAVSAHVLWHGVQLVQQAVGGLMDKALPPEDVERIEAVLDRYEGQGVDYHALRSRQSGAQRFVSVHIQVPGAWSVQRGHNLLEEIERNLRAELDAEKRPLAVFTHLEPLEDPVSWQDISLNRDS